ncbi:hypothetical protein HDU96_003637 [Phlyctochytrium bullatum]|nr:hypothetical protein HDU96_003637 [Phlyctochytrium bullatum]
MPVIPDIRLLLHRIRFPNFDTPTLSPTTPLPPPTLDTLFLLQRRLQHTLPYENLSVYHPPAWFRGPVEEGGPKRFDEDGREVGFPIRIDIESVFEKLVLHRRGGFCLELNTLYEWALRELGYTTSWRSAKVILRIPNDDLSLNPTANRPDFHIIMVVTLPSSHASVAPTGPASRYAAHAQGRWICDAGSTRVGLEPLPLLDGASSFCAGGVACKLVANQTWLGKHGWKFLFRFPPTAADPVPEFEHFYFFEDTPMPVNRPREILEKVTQPLHCPPVPGFTEIVAMPGEDDEALMVMGSAGKGYRFTVRDRRTGVEVENVWIEGGEGEGERERAWRECRVVLRDRFGIEGFGGNV